MQISATRDCANIFAFAEQHFQFLPLCELEGKTWENTRIENEIYDIEICDTENYFVSVGIQQYIIHR